MPTITEHPLTKQKQAIAAIIATSIAGRRITQTEAAWQIRDSPSQLSLICSGAKKNPEKYLRGFSLERLTIIASRLGADVTIRLRPNYKTTRAGKIAVVRQLGNLGN